MDHAVELIPREPFGVKARSFAAKGDPMEPGACRWCGAKLPAVAASVVKAAPDYAGARGDYGDNIFCGLRCGFMFGVQMADAGHRLRVKRG